jgi:MtN3 and saliva related transmembrane protein
MEEIIGYIAAFFTTISFIPQMLRVILSKSTKDISRNMYIILVIGVFLWLLYGFIKNDLPIILANSITLVFTIIILYYKLIEEDSESLENNNNTRRDSP